MSQNSFLHKSAIGVWVNDVRNEGYRTTDWPRITIDDMTEESLRMVIDTLSDWGYNELCLWGLLNSWSWSVDFSRESDEARLVKVRRIISYAHEKGIKIIYGFGIYSWGYDEFIKTYPEVRGDSDHAMCGSKEKSFYYMEKVIDFIFETIDVDGLHFESADLGRCRCEECSKTDDFKYHSILNTRSAAYVKRRWPGKIVMVNLISWQCWDDKLTDPAAPQLAQLKELAKHVDYIIDPGHYGCYIDSNILPEFTAELPCSYGSAGGFRTYFWPSWNRLRAFLPYTRTSYDAVVKLYKNGGRAVEYYTGPMRNPGAEINTALTGCTLNNPLQSYDDVLAKVVQSLYTPDSDSALKKLMDIFVRAEESFFTNWTGKIAREYISPLFKDFEKYRSYAVDRQIEIGF
ncbi:MAG: hypothetical protein FWF15_03395, partial [Oscillospiraceae bacterium]|nr:hypothetical protein [Oscillospiraceae bacterium]